MAFVPLNFIDEPITVEFDCPPALAKKPGCPQRFAWRGQVFTTVEKISEWHDYRRRGRMARNMTDGHLESAARRGSWGVGRDYYRVRTHTGRVFDLYYDRAPSGQRDRRGSWFLYREMAPEWNPPA
jgi:hypothetical protein